ncbi:hypothetical protein WS69_24005 [Burkholderia sp. BDU5]|nr:hypothetical protein WS69_24005 [Burkholderia sp. BDU5]
MRAGVCVDAGASRTRANGEGIGGFSSGVHARAGASMSVSDIRGALDGASAERGDARRLPSIHAAARLRTSCPTPMLRAARARLSGASSSMRPNGRVSASPQPA